MSYRFLEHTADVKFIADGKSLEEAFSEAAMAMKETITKGIKIKARVRKKIKVEGKDNSALLYNFLEEFLFLLDSEGFILSKVGEIKIKDGQLEAEILGDKTSNYKLSNDVKAVTYNNMKVWQEKGKFIVQVVLDV